MKPTKKASEMTTKELAQYIDYSVLKPEFTEEDIIALTKDGVEPVSYTHLDVYKRQV